jgi:hypothetical protein
LIGEWARLPTDPCGLIAITGIRSAAGVPSGIKVVRQLIPLQLTLQIQRNDVRVQIQNHTNHEIRVWDLGNAWGGTSWSLRLTVDGAPPRELRPTNQIYTINLPRYIGVPAHAEKELLITPRGHEWMVGENLAPLQRRPIHVQAALVIAPSPEAERHKVAIGQVHSKGVLSRPPHTWLFGISAA